MQAKIFGYTITIKKTNAKRRKGYSARAWTESEEATVVRFFNEGKSVDEMSELLHRTKAAIQNRLSRIKHRGVQR